MLTAEDGSNLLAAKNSNFGQLEKKEKIQGIREAAESWQKLITAEIAGPSATFRAVFLKVQGSIKEEKNRKTPI